MTVEELSNKSHITIEKENAELKEQIEQLSNDNHVLKTSFITQQEQIENLEKDKEQIIFESDLKIKALEDHIEKLEAESSSKDECIDNLEYQLKDAGDELELWQRENAELKKQVLKWHKVTCFDEPDKNGFITNDNPSDVGCDFIIKLKSGTVTVDTLTEYDCGIIFDNYDWEDIEAWCYIPEIKE